ncbi:hypothetical protein [Roseiflexus sp.]|uniref:hypothetical protein n=1 Tax=Roseiflexus sp. TaxID=2562120 RepID=UPI00258C1682|nr:hypothetical protein [Roseiflexus sp.]
MFEVDQRLFPRRAKTWVAVSAAAGLATVLLNIMLFAAIGWAVEALWTGVPAFSASAIAGGLILIAGKGFFGWLERVATVQAAADTKIAFRDTIYAHALCMGPVDLGRERTGELVNTAVDGMDWLEQYYSIYWAQFIVGMLSPVLVITYIATQDITTALILLLALPLPPLLLGTTSQRFKAVSNHFLRPPISTPERSATCTLLYVACERSAPSLSLRIGFQQCAQSMRFWSSTTVIWLSAAHTKHCSPATERIHTSSHSSAICGKTSKRKELRYEQSR